MDLLGSILSAMDKQGPPRANPKDKMLRQQLKVQNEKFKNQEKKQLALFRLKIEGEVNSFSQDSTATRHMFEPMEKRQRSIVHEVAEVAGLPAFSFGDDGVDRHVQIFKRDTAPSEKELEELRRCETWDLDAAKKSVKKREREEEEEEVEKTRKPTTFKPTCDYKEKYEHLIGRDAALEAAKKTVSNKQYGFVPSENKKDQRSIEQTLAEIRERKRQRRNQDEAAVTTTATSDKHQSSSQSK